MKSPRSILPAIALLLAACGNGSDGAAGFLNATLPSGVVATAYSVRLQSTGGTPPYGYSVTAGALPPGVTLSGDMLTGTPTQAGKFALTITMQDSGSPAATVSRDFVLLIDPRLAHDLDGTAGGDWFGRSIGIAGDVDNDGVLDIIVGAPLDDDNGLNSGSAQVFSGMDGSVLHTFLGAAPGDEFGWAVSGAGDVNMDGHADVVVSSRAVSANTGTAIVFSGMDGSTLFTFTGDTAGDEFGWSVAAAGDVNGDTYPDLIVGAPLDDDNGLNSGSARVFSGMDGSVLYTFLGDFADDNFGQAVGGAGDVNGDGFADLVVGAPLDDNNGFSSGSARVLSGFDGATLHTFDGMGPDDRFGSSVAGAGDVNSDTFADVIVGAPQNDTNGSNAGSARVFSGVDGAVLHTFLGDSAGDQFGNSVAAAGDLDGDGNADVIVGAFGDDDNGLDSGSARVFSGSDGSVVFTFLGDSAGDWFGWNVRGIGDIVVDGFSFFVVSSPLDDDGGPDAGSVRWFSGT